MRTIHRGATRGAAIVDHDAVVDLASFNTLIAKSGSRGRVWVVGKDNLANSISSNCSLIIQDRPRKRKIVGLVSARGPKVDLVGY